MTLDAPLLSSAELAALYEDIMTRRARRDAAASAELAGPYASAQRGFGLELYESRPYRPGDEPRHMDWRATARSGRPMTKVFRAEKQRSVFLIIDRSPSMAFATRGELKATVAARAAALLSFTAIAAQEPVAGAVAQEELQVFPSARQAEGALPLLRAAAAPLTANTALRRVVLGEMQAWEWLDKVAPPHANVYLLSDLQFLSSAVQSSMARLAARREVWALQIVDPSEENLPNAGLLRLRAPGTNETFVVDTGNAQVRRAYAQRMAERRATQQRMLAAINIPLRRLYTHADVRNTLQEVA